MVCKSGNPQKRDIVLNVSLSNVGAEIWMGYAPRQGFLHVAKMQRRLNVSKALTQPSLLEDLEAVKMNWSELGGSGARPAVGVAAQEMAIYPCDDMTWLGERKGSGIAAVRCRITVREDCKSQQVRVNIFSLGARQWAKMEAEAYTHAITRSCLHTVSVQIPQRG